MQLIRFQSDFGSPSYGWIFEDKVGLIEGSPYGEYRRMEAYLPVKSAKLFAPVVPSKVVCVGRNYADHIQELNSETPTAPLLFLKPPSAVIGSGEAIQLPAQSTRVEHEAELAVVIGRRARNLSAQDAEGAILGYTVANDVTARDLQMGDGQWTRSKGFDTFCPIGPWIETDLDPYDLLITCKVNEETRQMASTREMLFKIPELVAYISTIMTLMPGDVILTGTPAGVGTLKDGDIVLISIEGIGELRNKVKK